MRFFLSGAVAMIFLFLLFVNANFSDIVDEEYRESIDYLQKAAIVKGYPDGTFGPQRKVTRAEMLKIILKPLLTEEELATGENCFPDVRNERYAPYVCYAKENKIVRGYPDGTFKPDQSVTIAEGLKIALETFQQDVDETDDNRWYEPYVDFVHTANLFSKYTLYPEQYMTRAQMSFLVHQLLLDRENTKPLDTVRKNLSVGCEERSMPKTPPQSVIVRGMQRNIIPVVGSNVQHTDPTKLIIAFHGRTSPNTEVRQYYGLEKAWDKDAIIIYPSGLPEGGPSRNRRAAGDTNATLRGFELFDEIVEEFGEQYCIDLDEIYAVGHSLGAWFTHSLACARGDVLRATGSVGGTTTKNDCTGSVASLIMHNPNDRLAAFAGGVLARDQLLQQNNCGPETKTVGPSEGNCVEYINCTADVPVVRCPHTQNHARWDGSYYPHTRPNFAGKMIREFFEEHSD